MAGPIPQVLAQAAAGGPMVSIELCRSVPKNTAVSLCGSTGVRDEGEVEIDVRNPWWSEFISQSFLWVVVDEWPGLKQSISSFSGGAWPYQGDHADVDGVPVAVGWSFAAIREAEWPTDVIVERFHHSASWTYPSICPFFILGRQVHPASPCF